MGIAISPIGCESHLLACHCVTRRDQRHLRPLRQSLMTDIPHRLQAQQSAYNDVQCTSPETLRNHNACPTPCVSIRPRNDPGPLFPHQQSRCASSRADYREWGLMLDKCNAPRNSRLHVGQQAATNDPQTGRPPDASQGRSSLASVSNHMAPALD